MLWAIKTLWVYAVWLGRTAYCSIQNGCVCGGGSLKGRKEKKTERWVWGARTAPAPWSLGLLAEHMNPLTCKLLVAVN